MNKAMLLGFLGADPDLRDTRNSTVCHLSLATSEKFVKDDELQERTEWHRIVVWGKQAEACAKFLKKGSSVLVEGRIQTHQWEDSEGVKRSTTEIVAESVTFLDRKKAGRDSREKPQKIRGRRNYRNEDR